MQDDRNLMTEELELMQKNEAFQIPKAFVICSIYDAGEKLNKEWFYELQSQFKKKKRKKKGETGCWEKAMK